MSHKLFLNWERQLRFLKLTKFFYCALFVQPVLILYYGTKGLTLSDFFLLQPVFSLTTFFLQVPCGYFSDRWKRVNVMRLGVLFTTIGTVWMYFASNIYQLAFVPFFFGVGFSLSTSSFGAIVYDSLLNLGKEEEYPKIIGSLNAIGRYSLALSAIVSGFLYHYYKDAPVFVQMLSMVFYALVTWQVMEPYRKIYKGKKSHLKVISQTVQYVLFKHIDLKWVIVILSVLAVANTKAYWVIQPLVTNIAPSTIYLGFAAAITFVLSGISSQITHNIEHLISDKKLLLFAVLCSSIGYAVASCIDGLWMPFMLSTAFIAFGIAQVVTQTMINKRVSSDIRATTLAISSSVTGLLFSMVTPLFAWGIHAVDMKFALMVMSIFVACGSLTAWFHLKSK